MVHDNAGDNKSKSEDNSSDDGTMRRCCGCDISCDYRQVFTCPAMVKVFQTVLGGIACFLTLCTMSQRIEKYGGNFPGLGQLLTFYIVATLCVLESIVFLCFYIAVKDSPKNLKLKQAVKLLDVGGAILLLIAVVIFVYIMIKWQMDYANDEKNAGGKIPELPEMITTLIFTLINIFLYFLALFIK